MVFQIHTVMFFCIFVRQLTPHYLQNWVARELRESEFGDNWEFTVFYNNTKNMKALTNYLVGRNVETTNPNESTGVEEGTIFTTW